MSAQPQNLLAEIAEIEDSLNLKDYHAFILWYLEQTTSLTRQQMLQSICDGSHDKGIDAIIIDENELEINIIQSKFSKAFEGRIPESDVKNLSATRQYFKDRDSISKIITHSQPTVASLLRNAYGFVKGPKKFGIRLTLISTKRAPPDLTELKEQLGFTEDDAIYDRERILTLYKNYLKDFNPPLPAWKLKFSPAEQFVIKRPPGEKAYVLSVPAVELRDLYLKFGDDLFRKNVRDFLGANRANNAMTETLSKSADNFWYFNNGITMLCDKAEPKVADSYVEIVNPQIVNGCQTTKTIGRFKGDVKGSVLVRIVESTDNDFAANLTLFQNTSNPVKNRDLKSNDVVQVRLKRELGRRRFYFEIKRGQEFSKYRSKHRNSWKIDFPNGNFSNEELAKALAAIKLRPDIAASKGPEAFFDDYYEKLFPRNISTLECLRVMYLQKLVRDTYGGEKWHGDKAFRFKNRAQWYVLRYVNDSLRGAGWTKRIVDARTVLWEGKFFKVFKRIASEYFELLHRAWQRSKFDWYDGFLTSPDARKDTKSKFGSKLSLLDRRTIKLFESLPE